MSLENLSADDQRKLTEFIDKGLGVLTEIEDLRGGLKDTAKGLAENWDVKPSVLMAALRAAHKATLAAKKEEVAQVEAILEYANRI